VTLALTGALGVLITFGVGALVRGSAVETRCGLALRPPMSLSAWFHAVGLLATLAVLAPASGQDLLIDFCVRIGSLLLIEGLLIIGGVIVMAGRLHLAPDHEPVRSTREERP